MLIYLASPYSHSDKEVRKQRYEKAVEANAKLIEQGFMVYSPIVHGHPLNQYWKEHEEARMGWSFWEKFDTLMVRKSDALFVLAIDGWINSVGVTNELELAKRLYIPIKYVTEKIQVKDMI
jgi:hypothetical protein